MKKLVLILIIFSLATYAKGYKSPKKNEPSGVIELGYGSSKHEAEPVYIYAIDGYEIKQRTRTFLAPGKHVVKCKATHDLNSLDWKIPKGEKFVDTDENNTFEITIENGKSYYLGFSTKSEDIKQWKPVVFKVRDMVR